MKTGSAKIVRECTSCRRGLTRDQLKYSSAYPDRVTTSTGRVAPGTLVDAERVWCSADCASATYELAQLGLM